MPEVEEMVGPAVDASVPGDPVVSGDEPRAQPAELDARPRAFKVIHPKKPRPRHAAGPREPFPLSLLAGLLGLMSLAFAWNYESRYYSGYDAFTALRYIVDIGEYNTMYSVIVLLVLVGSILCFVTSLGATLQLAGVILYGLEFLNDPMVAGPGPFVAVAAALIGTASILVSPIVRVPSRLATFTDRDAGRLSVNVLALSAFVLGILSVLMVWVIYQVHYGWDHVGQEEEISLLAFLCDTRFEDISLLIVGGSLIVIGSVTCLLTPLGSVIQLAGTGLCFLEIRSSYGDFSYLDWSTEVHLGAGLYVAAAAVVVGLFSMMFVKRLLIPSRFTSAILVKGVAGHDRAPEAAPERGAEATQSRLSRLAARVPRMARAPTAVAVTLAVVIALLAAPEALSLSTLEVHVYNTSLYDIELDAYVDGELVSSGTVSPPNEYILKLKVSSGVHSVWLDYAYSGDDDPAVDGDIDWSSSVDADPYLTSLVAVFLMGDYDASLPDVTLSSAPSPDGRVITFESVVRYSSDGGTSQEEIDWSDLSLVVAEGFLAGAGWSFHTDDLDDIAYDQEYCGVEYLGALGLNCTAYDISGDGEVSVGDFITLTVFEGEFSSSEYVAYIVHEPSDAVIGQVVLSG